MKKLLAALLMFALGGAAYWYFVLKTPARKPTSPAPPVAVGEPQPAPVADVPASAKPVEPKPAAPKLASSDQLAAPAEQPAVPPKQENTASLTGVLFGVLSNVKSPDLPKSSSSKDPVVDTFGRQGVIEVGTADGVVRRSASNDPNKPASAAGSSARAKPIDIGAPKVNETGESRHATSRIAEKEARRAVGSER